MQIWLVISILVFQMQIILKLSLNIVYKCLYLVIKYPFYVSRVNKIGVNCCVFCCLFQAKSFENYSNAFCKCNAFNSVLDIAFKFTRVWV